MLNQKTKRLLCNLVCAYAFTGLGALPFSPVLAATTGSTSATTTPTQVGSDLTDTNLGGANQNTAIGAASGDSEVDDTSNGGCPNSALISKKLISNTCWTCIFPIITLGVPLGASKSDAPSDRYENPFCICYDRNNVPYFGFTYGLWMPSKAIELVRIPGCIVTFDGMELGFSKLDMGGPTDNNATQKDDVDYYHYHMFSYPLLIVLEMFQTTDCMKDKYMDFDILYLSEVDPTWSNAEIGFFTNPEIILFANPVALSACYADAVAASLFKKPINSLFWCAGSWGGVYPFFGKAGFTKGPVHATSLFLARAIAALHRRGMLKTTYGEDSLCKGNWSLHIPKSQYKFTELYPVPETHSAHVMGEAVFKWGAQRAVPVTGEDIVYLVWTWNDCCMSVVYGTADN
ncbi:MAG TPA: conjugal transfer protein TraU [Succinivibrionaceae bacterium]|nr:TraU family protein [Succinivibrio sp.]HAR79851.1 conjugal transfer protein TraU [Succinivibrionaceae bacterium]